MINKQTGPVDARPNILRDQTAPNMLRSHLAPDLAATKI